MEEKIRRFRFTCRGRVQGVGFRYRASRAARLLGLTGFVYNEFDGSVILELQGYSYQMFDFWKKLLENSYIDIYDKDTKEIPLVEDERGFSVRDYM